MPNPRGSVRGAVRSRRTRTRPDSPSLWRRAAAVLTTLALAGGLSVVGMAAPASAHDNAITGKVVCATDGSASIEWTVKNSERDKDETITSSSDEKVVPVKTVIKKGQSATFTQYDAPVGTVKLTLSAKWTKSGRTTATATNSGSVTVAAGQCDDAPTVKKITFCHATDSATNPYVKITTSVNAFFQAGHDDHQDKRDVYPAFSYEKQGKTITVAAQGDPSLLTTADCTKPLTKIDVPAKPAFSDLCGTGNTVFTEPADTTELDWTTTRAGGTITVSVKPQAGLAFKTGEASKTFEPFVVNDEPCPIDVPAEPAFSDSCGTGNTVFTEPIDTAELDWTTTRAGGTITVSVKPQAGFAFKTGEASKTFKSFVIKDEPCPATVITFGAQPTSTDVCGPGNGETVVPKLADGVHYSFVVTGSEAEGTITVTAVAKDGYTFDGKIGPWTFTFINTDCIELKAEPTKTDTCGVDLDAIVLPEAVDFVSWDIVGDPRTGTATAIATAADGHQFADGTSTQSFAFTFDGVECVKPTLEGSFATGQCLADAPWVFYDIKLTDPDQQSTGNVASLVLTDGTNSETIELGELVDGALSGKLLWPGASVAEDGVTPTGWPGWEQLTDGTWQETEGNFAWTRSVTEATIIVNPEMTVALSYPPATPNCANGPTVVPTVDGGDDTTTTGGTTGSGDGESTTAGGIGLASTGFAGTGIAIVAGIIVLAGAAFLVIARVRRKRA